MLKTRIISHLEVILLSACLIATPAMAEQVCTEMACSDGARLNIPPQLWKPGHYRFVFNADGRTTSCEGNLPLLKSCERALTCTGPLRVMIGESGCALPPENQGFSDIQIIDHPKQLTVTILHNDEKLYSQSMPLIYHTILPNGPHCGGQCSQANAPLNLTAP